MQHYLLDHCSSMARSGEDVTAMQNLKTSGMSSYAFVQQRQSDVSRLKRKGKVES